MMDFSKTHVVEISSFALRFFLLQLLQSRDKLFLLLLDPRLENTVRILVKDGEDPREPYAKRRWSDDQQELLKNLWSELATRHENQFHGRQFLRPEFLRQFLQENTSLPDAVWRICTSADYVVVLQRNGFEPRFIDSGQ